MNQSNLPRQQAGYSAFSVIAAVAVLVVVGLLVSLWLMRPLGSVSGKLVDYRSGNPVAGAVITVTRRGWGRSERHGQIIWDKAYHASAKTDEHGRFALPLPGLSWLVGLGGGSVVAEAEGFQTLRGIRAEPGASLLLQTVPLQDTRLPGGTVRLGWYADGTPFGWNFINRRVLTDLAKADIYPVTVTLSPLRVTLAAPDGGGLHFVSVAEQDIATPSTNYLLRYLDEPPQAPEQHRIQLDATPGTIFVRTTHDRYAKLAWDPDRVRSVSGMLPELERPADQVLSLPYIYRPLPGSFLPGGGATPPVDPHFAAMAAQLPPEGSMPVIPRYYRLELRDEVGEIIERLETRLVPGEAVSLTGCPHDGRPALRYHNLLLSYNDTGLPQIGVSVRGEHFAHHHMPRLVGLLSETRYPFNALDSQFRPLERVLVVREIKSVTGKPFDCDDTQQRAAGDTALRLD